MTSVDPSRTAPAARSSAPSTEPATAATVIPGSTVIAATTIAAESGGSAATVVTHPIAALPAGAPSDIGGVRLQRVLGSGAMGDVYLGRHATTDVDVAVKLMKADAGDTERFLQEVRAAARIVHPHVIQVLHAGTENGRLFLVMELVSGGDVAQLIKREGRVSWKRAVELMIEAAEGLGAAHRAGIVHRDVKPANFLLTGDGKLKVADLGLAKLHQHHTQSSAAVELTQAGIVMGTPAYMAPEQALDARRAGPPADVYALGVSLFHLLSGRLPFQAESSNAMLLAHASQPVPDLRALAADVPESVVAAVRGMLAKNPDERPRDGAAAAAALRSALAEADDAATKATHPAVRAATQSAGPGSPATASQTPPSRLWFLAVVVAVLAVIGFAILRPAISPPHEMAQAAPTAPASTGSGAPMAPAAADPWQSPTHASFVLSNDALSAVAGAVEGALVDARVLLVERAQLEQVMSELSLAKSDRTDQTTAVKAGLLVGGHVAVLVRPANDRVNLKAVAIQTGELIASDVVAPDQAPERALVLVHRALARLPVQGRLDRDVSGEWQLSVGRNHGVAVGERFSVYGDRGASSAPTAVATVTAIEATTATVTLAGAPPTILPTLAKRVAQ